MIFMLGPCELIAQVTHALAPLPDRRTGKNVVYSVMDAFLSALSVFFMQSSSFLAHQRLMESQKGKNNLSSLFGVSSIPCDNQIRSLLDPVPAGALSDCFSALHRCLEEQGGLASYRCFRGGYLMPMDGTEYFSSPEIHCPQCSERVHANGKTTYFHQVVTPVLIKLGCSQVLNLSPEFVRPQDGHTKQDCETAAAKRWLSRHPVAAEAVPVTMLGDDLYCTQPMCELAVQQRYGFIFVCKPGSHTELYEWVDYLERIGDVQTHECSVWENGKSRHYRYRFVNGVPLREEQPALDVNWLEVTITDKRTGKRLYFNTFATLYDLNVQTVASIAQAGRGRWKVENENNNVLKTKGYNLEHNFGHGQENLSEVLVCLNLLAFLMHTVLDLVEGLYQQVRQLLVTRQDFFRDLRTLTRYFYFNDWSALFAFMLTEGANSS
jgi:DNA-directed RNA polymerase subunit RPC12/RpoP